jgi:hypothetical protein
LHRDDVTGCHSELRQEARNSTGIAIEAIVGDATASVPIDNGDAVAREAGVIADAFNERC